jgi:mannose-6-phosphate isomerase-like protein (cupin superfamily)
MHTLRAALLFFGVLAACWLVLSMIGLARPESKAPESYYPGVGQVFQSRAEGFTQKIIKADGEHIWLELIIAPHAQGPPAHVHTTFAETFAVVQGDLSLLVGDQVKVIRAGEEYTVPPGTVHQPFNPTGNEVVVRGPLTTQYALPRDFGLFLSQMYGFMDESPAHTRPPAILLQMSIFAPRYDAWLARPPLVLQRVQYATLRPIARVLGYRSYYARFVPQAAGHAR